MINMLLLLLFFLLSLIIFIINNYYILLLFFKLNIIVLFIVRTNVKSIIKLLYKNIIFVLFIFVCNLLFTSLNTAIMTSLKLFNAIVFAYTISRLMPISQISEGFYYLFYPLKLFKVNIKNLSLIISIAITFIPIMSNEASEIKKSLISKGFNFNIKNVFTKPHIFLVTYFNNLFNKVDELEKALLMKGYE